MTATGPKVSATKVETAAPTTTTAKPAPPPPTVAFYGDALGVDARDRGEVMGGQTGKIKVVDGVASPICGIDRDQHGAATRPARRWRSRASATPGTASGPRP